MRDILGRHELVLGTVVSKSGEVVAQVGDRSRCACLADALLGPILDRPAKGLMVVVFGADEATTVKTDPGARAKAHYVLSKPVVRSIRDHKSRRT